MWPPINRGADYRFRKVDQRKSYSKLESMLFELLSVVLDSQCLFFVSR